MARRTSTNSELFGPDLVLLMVYAAPWASMIQVMAESRPTSIVLLPIDVPPSLRAEWHFIKNVFIVIAASLGGSTRRLCYRVLSMRLFFIPPWGSGHLTY